MVTRFLKGNSDVNAWIAFNNVFNSTNEKISLSVNANGEPPTVDLESRFITYKTDNSYTLDGGQATGNNEYSAGSTPTYLVSEAIYEDSAALNLFFDATIRGETLPTDSNGTWYLYCDGNYDLNSTTIGQGKYNTSKDAPTFSIVKKGWYHATHGRAIGRYEIVVSSTTTEIITMGYDLLTSDDSPVTYNFTPGKEGQMWIDTVNGNVYVSTGNSSSADWKSFGTSNLQKTTIDTGWIGKQDWTFTEMGSPNIIYGTLAGTFTVGEVVREYDDSGHVTPSGVYGTIYDDSGTVLIVNDNFGGGNYTSGKYLKGDSSLATAIVSSNTKDVKTDLYHGFNVMMGKFKLRVMQSVLGQDSDAIDLGVGHQRFNSGGATSYGLTMFYIDDDSVTLLTTTNGMIYTQSSGAAFALDNEDRFYRVIAEVIE